MEYYDIMPCHRAFDGIFGPAAELQNRLKACRKLKPIQSVMQNVTLELQNLFNTVWIDGYLRAHKCLQKEMLDKQKKVLKRNRTGYVSGVFRFHHNNIMMETEYKLQNGWRGLQ